MPWAMIVDSSATTGRRPLSASDLRRDIQEFVHTSGHALLGFHPLSFIVTPAKAGVQGLPRT